MKWLKMEKKPVFLFAISFTLLLIGLVQAQEVELTSVSGEVEVLLSGESDYTPAEEGMKLEASDAIRTSSGATAELSFNSDNSNLVRLSENTQARILLENEEKIYMASGEAFASVSSLGGGSFEIRTPTAVSGARGTDWVTAVTSEGTEVEAIDSQPYVRHMESNGSFSSQMTLIKPGQMTTVQKFKPPQTPREIPVARREKWQALKQDVRKRGVEAVQKRQQRPAFNRQEFLERKRAGFQQGDYKAGPGDRPLRSGQGFDQGKQFKPKDERAGPLKEDALSGEARKLGAPYKNPPPTQPKEAGMQPRAPGQLPDRRLQSQGQDKRIGYPQSKPAHLPDKTIIPAQGNRGPGKPPAPAGNKGPGAPKGSGPQANKKN